MDGGFWLRLKSRLRALVGWLAGWFRPVLETVCLRSAVVCCMTRSTVLVEVLRLTGWPPIQSNEVQRRGSRDGWAFEMEFPGKGKDR